MNWLAPYRWGLVVDGKLKHFLGDPFAFFVWAYRPDDDNPLIASYRSGGHKCFFAPIPFVGEG